MQYDANTPEDFVNGLEQDWRKTQLQKLRAIIRSKGPDLEEVISYKMLGYQDDKGLIFHLTAQRNYVSLYVGDAKKIDPDGTLLKGIGRGKGCIRFKKSTLIGESNIPAFIERAIALWKEGKDIGC